jgi:hypothetical protein
MTDIAFSSGMNNDVLFVVYKLNPFNQVFRTRFRWYLPCMYCRNGKCKLHLFHFISYAPAVQLVLHESIRTEIVLLIYIPQSLKKGYWMYEQFLLSRLKDIFNLFCLKIFSRRYTCRSVAVLNLFSTKVQAVRHCLLSAETRVRSQGKFVWDSWWTDWYGRRFSFEFSGFYLLMTFTPLFRIHMSSPLVLCNSPDQTEYPRSQVLRTCRWYGTLSLQSTNLL